MGQAVGPLVQLAVSQKLPLHLHGYRLGSLARLLLEEADEARQLLLERLSLVVEEERKRIASDIHDDTLQILAGLGIRLQFTEFDEAHLVRVNVERNDA